MSGQVLNRKKLEDAHYIRKASSHNYWFDFRENVFLDYKGRTAGHFCLVVTKTDDITDAYVLPYAIFGSMFEGSQAIGGRWTGTILNDTLKIHSAGKAMEVADYYNRFDLLEVLEPEEEKELLLVSTAEGDDSTDLKDWVRTFNKKFEQASPQRRLVLSERIARPGRISNVLRKLRKNICQVCDDPGFEKRNGSTYSEVHHIEELHKIIPGSYCSENMIVVCPTCHKKLHYASVEYRIIDNKIFEMSINQGEWLRITRNFPLVP